MIYPYQLTLALDFQEKESNKSPQIQEFGPLHYRIGIGLKYTDKNQIPIVKPATCMVPEHINAWYRVKRNKCNGIIPHFFTGDKKIEPIWSQPLKYAEMFKSYPAIISPDFSILSNMVKRQREWNDFRNKFIAAFFQSKGIDVIAAPSWGDDLCNIENYMEGWPHNSLIAINSTGVCQDKRARSIWLDGYNAMLNILHPSHIIRYGGHVEGEDCTISTFFVNDNRKDYFYGC